MASKRGPKWSAIKPLLATLSEKELIALVKDLFDASAENRAFLAVRFNVGNETLPLTLEPYLERVREPFYPKRGGFGKLNLADARKAIRDYQKASNHDVNGTLELLLTYVETGTRFTLEFGDIDERFYNSLASALDEAVDLILAQRNDALFFAVQGRLNKLCQDAGWMGWGYGDYLVDRVVNLEANFIDFEDEGGTST